TYDVVAALGDRTQLRHEHGFMALHGVWQAPVEARAHGAVVAAELRDDGLLAFLHDEEAGAQPDEHRDADDEARAETGGLGVGVEAGSATATTIAPTVVGSALAVGPAVAQQATELAVEVAPEFVQVGRALVGALAPRGALRRTRVVLASAVL